ncbi:MAG: phosphotransferase family protein, partial [bacterium]|nr:phosphotransferase family protein [bacterium]
KDLPEGMEINPAMMRRLSFSLIDNLAAIHAIDWAAIGLQDIGKPEGFLKRQVDGWSERYERAKTDEIPEVGPVVKWCKENVPPSPPATIIHNDYKFDNVVLDPNDLTRIIGVLDWEMSTVGDPLLDLGVAISYWLRSDDPEELMMIRMLPTNLEGSPTRREIVDRYAQKTGRDVSRIHFYFAFGLFKLAVIVQQIYYRFAKGYTQDPRFAVMGMAATILIQQAAKVIEKGDIEFK